MSSEILLALCWVEAEMLEVVLRVWKPDCGSVVRKSAVLLFLPVYQISIANMPENITAGEIARLPPYCAHTQIFEARGSSYNPTDAQKSWVAQMGPTFWAMHHYCWALVNANRSEAGGISQQQRQYLLYRAVSDCEYVLRLAPVEFVLLPEVYWRAGQYLAKSEKWAEALDYFEKSRAIKPDYWPPYTSIADVQLKLKRRQAALDILKAGLELMPTEQRIKLAIQQIEEVPSTRAPKNPAPKQPASTGPSDPASK